MSNSKTAGSPAVTSRVDIVDWRPEDNAFWDAEGKRIASRNLWISIPSLLCGFAIWLMWGIITVQMSNLGFPFSKDELFTLTAISGLAGATLRIPSSFFIRIAGGRNTIFLTTALLMIPAIPKASFPRWPLKRGCIAASSGVTCASGEVWAASGFGMPRTN